MMNMDDTMGTDMVGDQRDAAGSKRSTELFWFSDSQLSRRALPSLFGCHLATIVEPPPTQPSATVRACRFLGGAFYRT